MTVTTITTTIVSGPTTNLTALFAQNATPAAPVANSTAPSTNNASVGVVTNIMNAGGVSSSTQKITSSIANNFIDTIPYWKNKIMDFDLVALYNPSLTLGNKIGYFGGIDIPIGTQAALGAGVLHFDKQWGVVPINVKLGLTINYPVIGKVYNYFATGPYLDVTDAKLGTYNFIGAVRDWQLMKNLDIAFGFGVGDISTIKGLDYAATLKLDWHF